MTYFEQFNEQFGSNNLTESFQHHIKGDIQKALPYFEEHNKAKRELFIVSIRNFSQFQHFDNGN